MRRARTGLVLIGVAAAMAVPWAVPSPATARPGGFLPGGVAFVTRTEGAPGATLTWTASWGGVSTVELPVRVNALGCGPDRALYGLSTGPSDQRHSDGPHLVRVDFAGTVDDLGPVVAPTRYALSSAYAGTGLAGSDVLAVRSGRVRYDLDLTAKPATATKVGTLPAVPFTGDWAADPTNGDIYSVTSVLGRASLIRLPADGSEPVITELPTLPGRRAYGAVAVTPQRLLFTLLNDEKGGSVLYRVPLKQPETADVAWTGGAFDSSDAAACDPPAPPIVTPPSATPSPTPSPSATAPEPFVPAVVPPAPSPRPSPIPAPTTSAPPPSPPARPKAHASREPEPLRDRFVVISVPATLAAVAVRMASRGMSSARRVR